MAEATYTGQMAFQSGDEVLIYTSYFGNMKKILSSVPDARFISIAGKTPEWFKGERCQMLAPHYEWQREWHEKFKDDSSSEESKQWYSEKYYKTVLRDLDQLQVARDLKNLAEWHPTFMLCYETPEKFCHRHLVAEWLKKARIDAEEWKPN